MKYFLEKESKFNNGFRKEIEKGFEKDKTDFTKKNDLALILFANIEKYNTNEYVN